MSGVTTDPNEVQREAEKREAVAAIRESEFEDTGTREVAEALNIPHGRARKLVQELREEDRIAVTRQVGPAKLHRVAGDEGDA